MGQVDIAETAEAEAETEMLGGNEKTVTSYIGGSGVLVE